MKIRNQIRKIVDGRAEILPIRESKTIKPGFFWVEMYVTNLVGYKRYGAMQSKIVADLRAAGIPAESGYYGNEISFFVKI